MLQSHGTGESDTRMHIGMLLPSVFSIDNPGNGIAEQARQQADGLERLGHTVVRLNPWQWQNEHEFDVLHVYLGGLALHHITHDRQLRKPGLLVFSPIIDSNQANFSYRTAALLGRLSSRVFTVPGSLRDQARGSHLVVCRSRHERERITRGLGVAIEKTEIVLNGCHPVSNISVDIPRIRRELDLPAEFLLHISAYTQPRKNVLRLVEAAKQLGYPLVIAGRSTPGGILHCLERESHKNKSLRLLGFVDSATKNALYAMCKVFCLPSIHEGTGLVALEAGAHGANLVITKNGGPPDYFLEHADFVNPTNVNSIKEAIRSAWNKPRNSPLQQHINDTLTWDQSSRALEQAYRRHLSKLNRTATKARQPNEMEYAS